MQQHTANLVQPEGKEQERTEALLEHAIVTVVQCLLEQAEHGGRVSIANLRERVQTSKLLQCVKLLEELGILSPSGANNQRTLAVAQAKELLVACGAMEEVSDQMDEMSLSSKKTTLDISRLTKPLKLALLLLLEHGRAGEQASTTLFTNGMGIGLNKAVKIMNTLSENHILGPLDPITFQRSINMQCAIALLHQHGVSVPQEHPSSNNEQTGNELVSTHVAS